MRCGEREVRELVTCCDVAIAGNYCHKIASKHNTRAWYRTGGILKNQGVSWQRGESDKQVLYGVGT